MTADLASRDAEHALLCACIRFDADAARADELKGRIGAIGWDRFLAYADEQRLGSVLVRAVARLGLAPAVPALTLPDGRMTVTKSLAQREADHVARRLVLRERLAEIAAALGRAGIVPIALKGGRSIVTARPAWRHLRDIDLLIVPHRALEAQEIVLSLGYRLDGKPRPRLVHHHLHELYRDDLPGWIEIHRRGGPSRVEQFLPTAELIAAAVTSPMGVSVLPPHLSVLHGMVHHHVGHRAVKRALIEPKGLYEFAAEVMELSVDERNALVARAALHPRLLAILELWVAAAADLFGMPVLAPLRLAEDAMQWWETMLAAVGETGIGPELRAARHPARMRRARGGESAVRRMYWWLAMPLTFVKRPMILPRPWRRQAPTP